MNALFLLSPYKHKGLWVFDDPDVGLIREPFVLGIDIMMDRLTADIPYPEQGFTLIFSPTPFPSYAVELEWKRAEYEGNWYYCPQYQMEGWLCPALFKYFDQAPKKIFAKAERKKG